jgi:predicted Zn-dependent protease
MRQGRFIIALIMALFGLVGYYSSRTYNPVTQKVQHVGGITAEQEIALGLRAAPEMEAEFGGPSDNRRGQQLVDAIGARLVEQSDAGKTPYRFQFHLLDDDRTINAFALPGGQVFMTDGLARRLRTEGEMAGVLGHEIGHVVARHSAEHLAKSQLLQSLGGAAVIAAYDPRHPATGQEAQILAAAVTQLVSMKFGRNDELQADRLGVRLMAKAGYDPRSMLGVMEVLAEAGRGRGRPPEFFSTHPNPERRGQRIKEAIEELYPQGVPSGLKK